MFVNYGRNKFNSSIFCSSVIKKDIDLYKLIYVNPNIFKNIQD